ncbi:MAG: GGDEF domain-containing protein [Lachnospiraceae bacterium]|nr:GGDEF domain-containing protein [Lachnospiraceae bacterium]
MKMTVELFDNIINTSQDCVFWKDKDRRFLGINQAFLDFYGFPSADVLIGKNDEEMGWHSDPEPYKQDELRVLAGDSTYKVQGKCFIRGEERDIIASKRPLYVGNEIVGLVGSFVDITDMIRRQNKLNGAQVMYTIDKLRIFPFFDKLLDNFGLDEVLDPLTGILSRPYALEFAHHLISNKKPFSFTIVDLDNFKTINDTYGHSAGDIVLKRVAKGLAEATEGFGVVGRFGGDELLLIDVANIGYEDKKRFFEHLYGSRIVLRSHIKLDEDDVIITATSGCASYPQDADNFESLFEMIDKTLYLGKSKGRNCYTIYEESLHKDIAVRKLAKRGMYTDMRAVTDIMWHVSGFKNKLKAASEFLEDALQVKELYYIGSNGKMHAVSDEAFEAEVGDIAAVVDDDVSACSTLDNIREECPKMFEALVGRGLGSALIAKIRQYDDVKGYLVCAVDRSYRIWQENECAILYFAAGMLMSGLYLEKEEI